MLHCSHAFYSNYAEHLTSSSHRQEIQSYTFRRFTPMEYAALQMSKIEGFKYSSAEKNCLVKKLSEVQTHLYNQRSNMRFEIKFF